MNLHPSQLAEKDDPESIWCGRQHLARFNRFKVAEQPNSTSFLSSTSPIRFLCLDTQNSRLGPMTTKEKKRTWDLIGRSINIKDVCFGFPPRRKYK